jgi:hypothetical protein
MLDFLNRGLLFITNFTGYIYSKYIWKSHPVQRDFLTTDNTPAGGERITDKRFFKCIYFSIML